MCLKFCQNTDDGVIRFIFTFEQNLRLSDRNQLYILMRSTISME